MFQLQNYFSLGHIGGGAGRLERWIPLTSNLFKWKSKIAFSFGRSGWFSMSVNFVSFPTHPRLFWEEFLLFFFPIAVLSPIFHPESWPSVCPVRWARWVISPTGKWQHPSSSPPRNSAEPFTPLTQGRGWRVCGTLTCPEAALWLFWE